MPLDRQMDILHTHWMKGDGSFFHSMLIFHYVDVDLSNGLSGLS